MNKKTKTIIALSILILSSFSILAPTISYAQSPAAYVPITLTNNQGSPTVDNFQQLIKVNWSKYASYLNSNVSNVRFYSSSSFSSTSELYAWIETNNSTSAVSSNVWVNLSSVIIPASGSTIIYMAFLSKTSSWSKHWGLAPELSKTYGEFDNGAEVFSFYCNFAGTSLNSKWTTGGDYSGSVNNGLTLTSSGNSGGLYAPYSAKAGILEARWEQTSYQTFKVIFLNTPNIGTGWYSNGYSSRQYATQNGHLLGKEVSGTSYALTSTGTVYTNGNTYYIIGLDWNGTTGLLNETINYNSISSATDTTFSSMSDVSLMTWNGATNVITWIRVREYPPDNVMPSVSFGTASTVSTSGFQISFNQVSLPSGTVWGIRLNNTTSITWLNSSDNYDNFTGLPNGEYTFQVINATGYGSSPYSGVIDIDGKNITKNITFTGYTIQASETGLPQGDTWNLNVSDQSGLSESSKGQHLSSDTTSISFTLPNGTYTYSYQTSDHRYQGGTGTLKVSGSSYSFTVVFNPVLYYLNFTALDKPNFLEWAVNLSGTIKSGYGNISFQLVNGTYYWNASAINGTFQNPIGYYRLTNGSGIVLLHNESSFKGMRIIINGRSYNNNITFQKAYNITFEEIGIQTGTWAVNLSNGFGITLHKTLTVSSNHFQITFNSTEGNYTNGSYSGSITLTVYGPYSTRYINLTASSSITETVKGNNLFLVYNFITQYYLHIFAYPSLGGIYSPQAGYYNESKVITLTASANSSYQFTGFKGSNTSSYSGLGYYSQGQYIAQITMTNAITENITFGPYIVLTFYMQNLTSSTQWGVKLTDSNGLVQWNNGTGYYIIFNIQQGDYTYSITGIKSIPQSGTVSAFNSQEILLQFITQTYNVQFKENGLQPGAFWGINIFSNSFTVSNTGITSSLSFSLPNGSYSYTANSVYGYISNNSTGNFILSGKNIILYVNWTEGNAFILQGIRYFASILLNTSDYEIPSGTQIPINVNWTKYKQYENANLSNVIFMNSTFYPLYAWIENNASESYKSSTVWVKINQALPYDSSTTIYIAFESKDRNNFYKYGYLGEASQYSKPFGAYNNIAMVMNHGLSIQFFTNQSSASHSEIIPNQNIEQYLYAIGMNGTGIIPSSVAGMNFISLQNPLYSQLSGSSQNVPSAELGNNAFSLASENNVILNYYLSQSYYPGTFPSPPFDYGAGNIFYGKAEGFVDLTSNSTTFYAFIDDGSGMGITNNGTYTNWLGPFNNQNTLFNEFQASSGTPLSATFSSQGTFRISDLYAQATYGYAFFNLWTNYNVKYYSPSFVSGLSSLIGNISIGAVASSYNSFYEYGLPTGTNWTIAISGPGITKLYTSDSNLIYTYLPNGTYLYTVGSFINGSYHSGIDGKFIPSPSSGHVIVTGAFTVQYIIFSLNQVLKYDLTPEQASGQGNNITLPILVINIQGLPAGLSTIDNVIKYLNASLIAKNENQTTVLRFTISQAKEGMIVIFLNISQAQIDQVKNGSAVVSFVSGFQLGTIEEVAAGVAGSEIFSSVSGSSPVVNNTKTNTNTINQIISYLAYLESQDYGRALYLVLVLLAIMFYVLSISKHLKKKKNSKA